MADIATEIERGSTEWFDARIAEIREEARAQRIPFVACIDIFDPLDPESASGAHDFMFGYTGGLTNALGLCERMKLCLIEANR